MVYSSKKPFLLLSISYCGKLNLDVDVFSRKNKLKHSGKKCLPGASVRNSAHGKGHEEGGLAYAKA